MKWQYRPHYKSGYTVSGVILETLSAYSKRRCVNFSKKRSQTSGFVVAVQNRLRQYHGPQADLINPLNAELNTICYLLALLGAHHFLHVSRIRVKSLTFSLLISCIYMEHPFLMFLDHTQRRSTVGRTPLDE